MLSRRSGERGAARPPPDLLSQVLLLVPLLLLFEGALLVMWLGERREAKEAVVPAPPA